jgi:tetratricopeptide (TPR) repeat protein
MDSMLARSVALLFLPLLPLPLAAQGSAVKVQEGKVTLPTYEEGAPDPNPQFGAFYADDFPNYPYTIRRPEHKTRHLTQWRVVFLENEYLSCRVLPDLGGHLQGCTDKITGREIFYSNPVIRRDIASARGSFISTGIESSFPIAHSRVSSSPVDFAWSLRDGVGRVVVEDTDRTSGMQWRDEFILRPGSALLEQRVTLYNRSTARRGYHWWANAAVELDDPHLRIVYPVKWMLPHGDGPMTSWPIGNDGVDLSDISNDKTNLGLFAHASREPWMAIYKPKFRSGLAHYADPDRVKGKKVWIWGSTDTYVRQFITDNFNSYVEMQAGEFETQPEFGFLLPEETKTFTHYWIPFRDLGGISRATRDAVLNLSRTGQTVLVELNATHAMHGAKIRLSDGAGTVSETQMDLDPRVKFAKTLQSAPAKLTVDVVDASGTLVLHHIEDEYDSQPFDKTAKNPEPTPPTDKIDSEAAAFARGTYDELRDQWSFAWHDYAAGLKKFPGSVKLGLAAGRAAFVLGRYDDAIHILGGMADTNAEAGYYFAMALIGTSQRLPDARDALTRASKDPLYGAAARLQSALLAARESGSPGRAPDALRALQALASASGAPAGIGALEVAMLRRTGQADEARRRLDFWLEQDPANNMLRVERSFVQSAESGNTNDPSVWEHLGADPERLLNVAEQYRQLGACDDALKLLDRRYAAAPATETEPGTLPPQENPLVAYFRGYCRLKTGGDPNPDFKTAATLSTLYVFPNRPIYFAVFDAALQVNLSDPVAHALLGDLYFNSDQTDDAIAEWKKALALKRDLPALHRNLGRALLEIKNDPTAATPVLLEGRRLDPEDPEIAEALKRLNNPEPRPGLVTPTAPGVTAVDVPKGDVAGRALVQSATNPDEAAGVFNAANFPKEKQPDAVRRAYIEVQLQRLLDLAHRGKCRDAIADLETLGDEDTNVPFTLYGFGAFMKPAHFQYYIGVIENACGEEKSAKKRWSKLARSNEPIDSVDYVYPYLAAKSLGESDAPIRIDAALQALRKAAPSASAPAMAFSQGALLIAAGKRDEGYALLQKSLQADPFVQYLSVAVMAEASRK